MQRILIAGTSGSGKSTLARRVSVALAIPYVELDSLYHGPNWTPRDEFIDDVSRFIAQDAWVIEWQYGVARPLLAARATTLVWIDIPKWRVMQQVTARTLRRRVRRMEIWNGNREGPLWRTLTDRDHIIRWAWRTHPETSARVARLRCEHPNVEVVRLRSPHEIDAWVDSLSAQ